jgi:hypothetical protein
MDDPISLLPADGFGGDNLMACEVPMKRAAECAWPRMVKFNDMVWRSAQFLCGAQVLSESQILNAVKPGQLSLLASTSI